MTNGMFNGINFNNNVNFNNVSGGAYNRFVNLDGYEDRIIYHLLSPNNKSPEQLRKLILFGSFYVIQILTQC